MEETDSSQFHTIQTVQRSSVQMYIGKVTNAAAIRNAVNEAQQFLNSRFPGVEISFGSHEDTVVESGHMAHRPGREHQIMAYNNNNQILPRDIPTGESSGIDVNSPPVQLYPPLPPQEITNHDLEVQIAMLKSQVDELEVEKKRLVSEVEGAATENNSLVSNLERATQERDELARLRQISLAKIRKLNDMIIKNSQNSDEPLDDVVLQEMFKIRNMTTEVVRQFFSEDVTFSSDKAKNLGKQLNDNYYPSFYKTRIYPNKVPERRRRLLISLLFRELQILFFGQSAKRFGMPTALERSFQEFERMIEESNQVDIEENLNWRTSTVTYAGRLGLSRRETIEQSTERFLAILRPMALNDDRHGNPDKRQLESLTNAIWNLCGAAINLAVRFRSSKTKYEFKSYPDDTILAACDMDLIKMTNSEGRISEPRDLNKLRIYCTLFGALVKTRPPTPDGPSDPVLLEPGNIIVYEPQQ